MRIPKPAGRRSILLEHGGKAPQYGSRARGRSGDRVGIILLNLTALASVTESYYKKMSSAASQVGRGGLSSRVASDPAGEAHRSRHRLPGDHERIVVHARGEGHSQASEDPRSPLSLQFVEAL
jgi:hypothetical protein